jgi:hypothetical protein
MKNPRGPRRLDLVRSTQTVTQTDLKSLTVDELVDRFAEIGVAQDTALWDALGKSKNPKFNRLYWEMDAVDKELRARGRDARLALLRLYNHKNIQVRLKAAMRTLGVAPVEARKLIEQISASKIYPQAATPAWRSSIWRKASSNQIRRDAPTRFGVLKP